MIAGVWKQKGTDAPLAELASLKLTVEGKFAAISPTAICAIVVG